MNVGNHLDFIIAMVKANKIYEEPWNVLLNAYFRGDDGFEKIEDWARSVGLRVSFSNQNRTCIFLEAADQTIQGQLPQ